MTTIDGTCGAVFPGQPPFKCCKRSGHSGSHEAWVGLRADQSPIVVKSWRKVESYR